MNRIDQDLMEEFQDVTSRLRGEFDSLDVEVPAFTQSVVPARTRRPLVRLAIAASVAAAIAIAPTFTDRNSHVILGNAAWAAVPTKLSAAELADIKQSCTKLGEPAAYDIAIADERMERGFMILKADRGPSYEPALRRFATVICKYERVGGKMSTPSIFLAETPSLGNATSWGQEELGNQKVWIYVSAVKSNVSRVEITTAQGLVFEATVENGYTCSWWPRLPEVASEVNQTTDAYARFYDAQGNLLKTFSLLNGTTTTPDQVS